MTRQEYIEKQQRAQDKKNSPITTKQIAQIFIAVAIAVFTIRFSADIVAKYLSIPFYVVPLAVAAIFAIVGFGGFLSRLSRCPHCEFELKTEKSGLSVATGKCTGCGKPVFDDAATTGLDLTAADIERATYQEHFDNATFAYSADPFVKHCFEQIEIDKKRKRKHIWIFGIIFCVCAIALNRVIHHYDKLPYTRCALIGLYIHVLLILPGVALIAAIFHPPKMPNCPICRLPLAWPAIVAATGRCPTCCGKIAVTEPKEISQ